MCRINIRFNEVSSSVSGRLARAMQKPFPQLTDLELWSYSYETTLVFPGTFLGGSAPHLRCCYVDYLPFPALRNLLFSAPHCLTSSGFASRKFRILRTFHPRRWSLASLQGPTSNASKSYSDPHNFASTEKPDIRPDSYVLSSPLSGVSASMRRTSYPGSMPLYSITLFHQLTFDVSQLHQFIGRTETFSGLNIVNVGLDDKYAAVELSQQRSEYPPPSIRLEMPCKGSDWQLSFLAQACSSLSPTLSTFETLKVLDCEDQLTLGWEDEMENGQWLEIFHPFTSVKNLHLSEDVAPLVVPALQELTEERVTDVLPALQNLYIDLFQTSGLFEEGVSQFVAARQLSNQAVTVKYCI